MIDFSELLFSPTGRILISIIWGLGLAALFRNACKGRNCQVIQFKGPDPNEIRNSYYKYGNDNCYQYTPYLARCETN